MPRVSLSAYDRLFLAGHEALQRRGLPGHHCLIWLELNGRIDRAALDAAYQQASRSVPVVSARIRCSLLTGRAHWRYLEDVADVAPIETHDLTAIPDPAAAMRQVLVRAWREPQNPGAGRQLRLFCFEQTDRTTLVLRWPHYLMDLEGAQGFLLAMRHAAAFTEPPAGAGGSARNVAPHAIPFAAHTHPPPPTAVRGSEAPLAYPSDWSGRWIRKWWEGVRRHSAVAKLASRQLPEQAIDPNATADFINRHWTEAETARIIETGRKTCRPGPMLHTRHLIAATVRGLDDLAEELGMTPGDHYLVPLPMLRPRRTPRTKLACNDLIIATLVIQRDLLRDAAALDESLMSQIDEYTRGADEATWVFMSYVGLLRKRHYEWMLRRKRMMARCSIGFTTFRADGWADGFLGSSVTNSYACGLPPIPPGVILTYVRHGDRLNLGTAFFPHVCTAGKVDALIARIGHHLGARI